MVRFIIIPLVILCSQALYLYGQNVDADKLANYCNNNAGSECWENIKPKALTIANTDANVRPFSFTFELNREIRACCPGCPYEHIFSSYEITVNGTFTLDNNKVIININPIVFRSNVKESSFDLCNISKIVDFINSKNNLPIDSYIKHYKDYKEYQKYQK